jgi:branched-chain amino acid transport system substrate-binding protein
VAGFAATGDVLGLLTALGVAAAVVTAAVAGCVAGDSSSGRIAGHRLTIYVSLPEQGQWSAEARAVEQGAALALAQVHGRIGRYRVAEVVLDDSTAQAGTWVPGLIANNAHQAAADKTTIGYLGEFNPDASSISIPVLNRAGIPQISPADAAAGLTADTAGGFPGEPEKYYPTGTRTFARVTPSDRAEALAQVRLQLGLGCTKTYVLDDGSVYASDLAGMFEHDAGTAGLRLAGAASYAPTATSYPALAPSVAASGADCVLLSANAESHPRAVTSAVAAALPAATIFATDGVGDGAYANPALGGIPFALDRRVYVTMAPLPPTAYPPASRAFFAAYRRAYGPAQPYSIYGYAAMSLLLSAIDRATHHGRRVADRAAVLAAIFATRDRRSVLGTYSIGRMGDTSLRSYGAYRIAHGRLVLIGLFGG